MEKCRSCEHRREEPADGDTCAKMVRMGSRHPGPAFGCIWHKAKPIEFEAEVAMWAVAQEGVEKRILVPSNVPDGKYKVTLEAVDDK